MITFKNVEFSSITFETISFVENRAYHNYLDPASMQPVLFRLEESHVSSEALESTVALSGLTLTKNVFDGGSES